MRTKQQRYEIMALIAIYFTVTLLQAGILFQSSLHPTARSTTFANVSVLVEEFPRYVPTSSPEIPIRPTVIPQKPVPQPILKERCSDGMRDLGESDIDCGGSCTPCTSGKTCTANTDCKSGYCRNAVCNEVEISEIAAPAPVGIPITTTAAAAAAAASVVVLALIVKTPIAAIKGLAKYITKLIKGR